VALQPPFHLGNAVDTIRSKYVYDVSAADKDDRMLVLAHLPIHLVVEVGRRHENTELAESESRYKTAHLTYTDGVVAPVALRFECELHTKAVREGPGSSCPQRPGHRPAMDG
jgi:hypothetical protein